MLLISLLSVDTFSYRQDIYYHKRKYLSTTFLKFFLFFSKFNLRSHIKYHILSILDSSF